MPLRKHHPLLTAELCTKPPTGSRIRRSMSLVACALLLMVGVACARGNEQSARSIPIPVAVPTATATPLPVIVPRDDAPHGDLTEWWYYTGHLDAADGRTFGFQYVIFQAVRSDGPVGYAAHFAITDLAKGTFSYDQRSAIGAGSRTTDRFDLSVNDWWMSGANGVDKLVASMPGYAIDIGLTSAKPIALHNGTGVISFGPAGDSYYFSRTRMPVAGNMTVDGVQIAVTGTAWMDRQWGNFVFAGGGWDWFSMHLDDQSDLTGSIVRDDLGNVILVYGTLVDPTGKTTHLTEAGFRATALDFWMSPKSGANYPSRWRITLPDQNLDMTVSPVVLDQELDARTSTGVIYWEGAVAVTGTREGRPLTGRGYVELTGYAGR